MSYSGRFRSRRGCTAFRWRVLCRVMHPCGVYINPGILLQMQTPLADANGYVTYPNVRVVDEMIDMISASRSYKADADVANAAKALYLKTLTL